MMTRGWYPDPHGEGDLRWWDGYRWTERTAESNWPPKPGRDLERTEADGRRAHSWLWAGMGIYIGQYLVYALTYVVIRDLLDGTWTRSPSTRTSTSAPGTWFTAVTGIGQLASFVLIAVGVIFAVWLMHAAELSRRLGLPASHPPSWAFWAFIIPVVNLWFPYQVARDCLPPDHPGRRDVLRWWLLYLTMGFVSIPVVVLALVSAWLGIAGACAAAVVVYLAGTAAQRMIATITAAQRELVASHLGAAPRLGS